jgi:uncharacterized damage-inducible protein DinB
MVRPMPRTTLEDAFGHHAWATLRLIDTCAELAPEQLATTVPGTYGSIIDTLRHIVGADAGYLFVLTGGIIPRIDEDAMDLPALRAATETYRDAWLGLVAQDLDPEQVLSRRWDDGTESYAPIGIRLSQALHHGTDHRSQVCTALTSLGIEPPEIDVWAFAVGDGRLVEVPPSA